jgi:Ca-activated chloride channel family protein
MIVGRTWVLWLLLALLPILAIQLRLFAAGGKDLVRLGASRSLRNVFVVKWFFTALFFDLFLVTSILAAADLQWGERPVEEDRDGLEIVFTVDVSRSMLAADPAPSRLSRTADLLRGLVERLPGSRYSLVAFKGRAVPLIPPTEDRVALGSLANQLSPELLSAPGTNLADALSVALDAFTDGSRRHRVLVLFTDGESLEGSPLEEASRAAELGVPIFSVAAGSEEGSTIRLSDGSLLRDSEGEIVVSRVDADLLERIAEMTGGQSLRLSDADVFSRLLGHIEAHVSAREERGFRLVSVSRYRLFVGLALVFLLLHMSVRFVKWRGLL